MESVCYLCLILTKINQNLDVSTNFSKNVLNVKFYENPCRESRVVDEVRQVDMTNLRVCIRSVTPRVARENEMQSVTPSSPARGASCPN
jgi:hypothetical protein